MRILFGPDHDGLHVSPDTPGAYEWWYFDALSDDGRFALVAIFFLGTPMSPYYKQVVDGKNPLPRDWCGVFFSLHENVNGRWKERAYAYNLYRGGTFEDGPLNVQIGNSRLYKVTTPDGKQAWHLQIEERGLWRHTLRADLHFVLDVPPLSLPEQGDRNNAHTWVCVAPQCKVLGRVTLPSGEIPLYSEGYHDHNFGQLPWNDVDVWYWANVSAYRNGRRHDALWVFEDEEGKWKEAMREGWPDVPAGRGVFYAVEHDADTQIYSYFFDIEGRLRDDIIVHPAGHEPEERFAFGFCHRKTWYSNVQTPASSKTANRLGWNFDAKRGARTHGPGSFVRGTLSAGPFYRRMIAELDSAVGFISPSIVRATEMHGWGIGEVFRPARLCGPIASRAMWTRIRRRS